MSSSSPSTSGAALAAKEQANPTAKERKKPYPMYLGGLAASIAAVATHPLDVSKVRMQTSKHRSMFKVLTTSIKTDGIVKGAYAGLSASLLRQLTYSLTRFAVYDKTKEYLAHGNDGPLPIWKLAIAGSAAGAAGGLAGNPADIVLVRMISDVNRPAEQQHKYKHAIQGVTRVVKEEGAMSLFRGLGPNVTRAILMNSSQLASYDFFKRLLLKSGYFSDNLVTHFAGGLLAGTVATTVCAPFDVLKSRIMNSSGNETVTQIIRGSFAKEGLSWCFRGWTPAWIRLAPNSLIIFISLEQLRNLVDRMREKRSFQ
ncbi:mitochondrial carrier [Cystobasidium minutum MCA 4210]|uniref:mitochondrial carrier n=1 Tax=Cystobasidium minutum MCA 4210 TaxID=1397322 RepID=UPI0034CEC573|eukprot:jgi/Rhomi1/169623/fgenesh1_kg.3_\